MRRKDPARWLTIYFPHPSLLRKVRETARLNGKGASTLVREMLETVFGP